VDLTFDKPYEKDAFVIAMVRVAKQLVTEAFARFSRWVT